MPAFFRPIPRKQVPTINRASHNRSLQPFPSQPVILTLYVLPSAFLSHSVDAQRVNARIELDAGENRS